MSKFIEKFAKKVHSQVIFLHLTKWWAAIGTTLLGVLAGLQIGQEFSRLATDQLLAHVVVGLVVVEFGVARGIQIGLELCGSNFGEISVVFLDLGVDHVFTVLAKTLGIQHGEKADKTDQTRAHQKKIMRKQKAFAGDILYFISIFVIEA
jgi:uncharacterized membrane protein AbrB (regulator of aidB expression)